MAKRRLPWEDDVASSPEPLRAANRHKDGHVVASSPESDGGFELIFSSSPPYLPLRVRSASGASDDASSGDIDSGYHGASPPRCSTPYGHGESGRAPSDCNLTATEPATPSPCPSSAGGAVRVLPSAATPPDARAAAERPPDCNTSPSVVQISPSSDEFGHLDWPESDQDGVPQAGAAAEVLPAITLTPEQSEVFDQVVNNGRSVFFTGAAGTGKSLLTRELIRALRLRHPEDGAVAVTATTGLAAQNINGMTLNAWAGVGLAAGTVEAILQSVQARRSATLAWRDVRVLLIDEVSMLDGALLDILGAIARKLSGRRTANDHAFGNIQLVVTGDFYQLPPVASGPKASAATSPGGPGFAFAFESEVWSKCITHVMNLTRVQRQSDRWFVEMLNELRLGVVSVKWERVWKGLQRPLSKIPEGRVPTYLYCTNADVDRHNARELDKLAGKPYRYWAQDNADNARARAALGDLRCRTDIRLKVGAPLLLIKNTDEDLVNGTFGVVRGFGPTPAGEDVALDAPYVEWFVNDRPNRFEHLSPAEFTVEDAQGITIATRVQLPVILAWAMTIHKAQGQTLEYVRVDVRRARTHGQIYVAVSRARTKEGLQLVGFNKKNVGVDPRVVAFCRANNLDSAPEPDVGSTQ